MSRSEMMLAAMTVAAAREMPVHEEQCGAAVHEGGEVLIRPIRKQDMALESRFIERLSPVSRRCRFFGSMKSPSNALLTHLIDVGPSRDVALIALIVDGKSERAVGVARLSVKPGGKTCEFAVAVSDEWQQRGLGTLLMQRLIDSAMSRGLNSVHAFSAASNDLMRQLAQHLGFVRSVDPSDMTQVLYRLELQTRSDAAI